MDITMDYYLNKIRHSDFHSPKRKMYIQKVKNEIYSYRSTAFLNRGKNVARICNRLANILEKNLMEATK